MVATEWYKIFSLTVPSTWIAFILAAILTGIALYVKFGKEAANQFGDIVFVFLFVWKFSVLFTDLPDIIQHPWMLLYFSGERTGVYFGVLSVILYTISRSLQRKPFLLSDAIQFSFISFYSSYAVLVVFLNQSSLYNVLLALSVSAFLVWLFVKHATTIDWVIPFLIGYGAMHLLLRETLLSSSMLTASILALILFLRARKAKLSMSKKSVSLSIIALLYAAILWTMDETVLKQRQLKEEVGVLTSEENKAPNFTLPSITGKETSLTEYKGKRVILNFWATWCPPCKAEMPHMQKYFEDYAEKQNATILAVNLTSQDNGLEKIQQFKTEYNLTFPILLDEKGDIASRYGIITIPTTFILDEEGNVAKKITGPVSEHMLVNILEHLDR